MSKEASRYSIVAARMLQFAEAFPDREIVAALLRQLGWSRWAS